MKNFGRRAILRGAAALGLAPVATQVAAERNALWSAGYKALRPPISDVATFPPNPQTPYNDPAISALARKIVQLRETDHTIITASVESLRSLSPVGRVMVLQHELEARRTLIRNLEQEVKELTNSWYKKMGLTQGSASNLQRAVDDPIAR